MSLTRAKTEQQKKANALDKACTEHFGPKVNEEPCDAFINQQEGLAARCLLK